MAAQTPPPAPLPPPPVYTSRERRFFTPGGLVDLLVLVAIAAASALTALHFITPKRLVEVDTPTGPLAHLDDPQAAPSANAPIPAAPGP